MGDPAGIGPEIILKACSAPETGEICNPVVVGEQWVLEEANQSVGAELTLRPITRIAEARFEPGILNVLNLGVLEKAPLERKGLRAAQQTCDHRQPFFKAIHARADITQVVAKHRVFPLHPASTDAPAMRYRP